MSYAQATRSTSYSQSATLQTAPELPRTKAWRLRFDEPLEAQYQQQRHEWLRSRALAVGWFALAVTLAYCLSDIMLLPMELYAITLSIRLLVIVPATLAIFWALHHPLTSRTFLRVYTSVFLIAGFGIVGIIAVARWQAIALPYEGLLLITMFGYLIMGLPFRVATLASLSVLAAYVLTELIMRDLAPGMMTDEPLALGYNLVFLLTTNVIGATGAFMQEKNHRHHFLQQASAEASQLAAEQENAAKTRLLAAASHDLRQPLHAMNLHLESLQQDLADTSHARQVDALQRSLAQLNQLLGDLLDLSRLEVGVLQPHFAPFDLHALIHTVVEPLAIAASPPIIIDGPAEPVWIRSDRALVMRILANLIENARKHAAASQIEIIVQREAKTVSVCVRDDGRGIAPAAQQRLFGEFVRAGDTGGLGLGLAIVQRSAKLLAAPLSLSSAPSDGAAFTLQFPAAAPVTMAQQVAESGALAGLQLILVDDEAEVLQGARQLLASWGVVVSTAQNAAEALHLCTLQPRAMLVSDLHLGSGDDGLTMLANARRAGFQGAALIWTADTTRGEHDLHSVHQPACLVHKPLRPARLRRLLRDLQAHVDR